MVSAPSVLHSVKIKNSQQALHVFHYDQYCTYSKSEPLLRLVCWGWEVRVSGSDGEEYRITPD